MTVAAKLWQVTQDTYRSVLGEVFNPVQSVWPGEERPLKAMAKHDMQSLLRYLRMRPLAAEAFQPLLVGPSRANRYVHFI